MNLLKLELVNYRLFNYKLIEFDPGFNLIQARNGTGKTTIVEAIGFALFGTAMTRGKARDWIRKGQTDGGVKLYLDNFVIERTNKLALVTDLSTGNILARNKTGISEWVTEHYGLTPELFKTSFFIGQKEIGSFAALSPLERTKRVEKILRIDKLDAIKDEVKIALRLEIGLLEDTKNSLSSINLGKPIEDVSEQLKLAKAKLENKLIEYGAYKTKLEAYQKDRLLIRQWHGIDYDLEQEEKEHEEKIAYNSQIKATNDLINEKLTLRKKLKDIKVLPEYFTMQIEDLMNLKITHKNIQNIKKELEKLNVEPKKEDNLKLLYEDTVTAKRLYNTWKSVPATCPTCEQPWPKKPPKSIDQFKKSMEISQEKYQAALARNKAYELVQELNSITKPSLSLLEIEEALISLRYKDTYNRYLELNNKVPNALLEAKPLKNIIEIRKQVNIKQKIQNLEAPEEIDIEPYKREANHLTAIQEAHESYKRLKKESERLELKLKLQETKYNSLKNFLKFIDNYRKAFGQNVIPLLEKNVSNIVNYLSEGKYEKVKINSDYGIEDFEYFSGSEQDSISLALRLSLAQISRLGSFRTLILDEVAASFDSTREKLLLEILKAQENQLIYITHGDLN